MTYITVKLTEDQWDVVMQALIWLNTDRNPFTQRIIDKLAKAKTV